MMHNQAHTLVTNATSMARVPVMAETAHTKREDVERREIPQQQPTIGIEPTLPSDDDRWRYNNVNAPEAGKYVQDGKVGGFSVDSEEAQEIVKHINTQSDLKINQLTELAGYMRWGTLGLMASAFGGLYASLGIGAVGASAIALPAAIAFGVAALALGTATLLVSQSARKLQAERWIDIQEFLQDRGAVKVGKQVAQSLESTKNDQPSIDTMRKDGKSWTDAVVESQALDSKTQLSHI